MHTVLFHVCCVKKEFLYFISILLHKITQVISNCGIIGLQDQPAPLEDSAIKQSGEGNRMKHLTEYI